VKWAYATGTAIAVPPLVVGDIVYVATQSAEVLALRAEPPSSDGQLQWRTQTRNPAIAAMLHQSGTLYVPTAGALYAIHADTHETRWKYDASNVYGTPILMGDSLLIQGSKGVLLLDQATGTAQQSMQPLDSSANTGLSTDGEQVYVGYFDGKVVALKPSLPQTKEIQP
jgi:outer membrane protein assembly factor BamB